VCAGVERIYVARERHDEFVDALVRRARKLRIGRGDDPATELGALVSGRQRARVEDLVAEARERGAEALCGGRRPDVGLPGWFYEPTVMAGGDGSLRLEREEVFGPVVTVASFADEDEAVALANSTPFGLGASAWTRDNAERDALVLGIDAGAVFINGMVKSDPRLPFGGIKHSGYGRELGTLGIREFVNAKTVWIGPAKT